MMMDERLNPLDELGDALERHEQEADRKDELDGPADEAAGIGRHLVNAPGIDEPWPGEIDEDQADREQKEQATEDVDPDAHALGHGRIDEVDPYMLVHLERIRPPQQDHPRAHVQ